MRRREFIALAASVAAWPVVAGAQSRTPRIAFLSLLGNDAIDPRQLEGLRRGLTENGLVDGRTITLSSYFANGDLGRLRQLASDVVQGDFDVILTAGSQAVRALIATGTRAPIVFAVVGAPVSSHFIESLAHPGGNITGLSMANADLERKRVEILKDAVPSLHKLMVLHDPTTGPEGLDEAASAARALTIEPVIFEAGRIEEFEPAFQKAIATGSHGLTCTASPVYNFHRKRLTMLALQHRLPSIWETAVYVRDGGLLSYGPDFPDMYRRAGGYVAKILAGAKPADLPVQQPLKFDLAVNLKTAKALGLSLPPTLLARADEVVE